MWTTPTPFPSMLNFTNKARPSLVPLLIPPLATDCLFLAQSHYANTNKSEHRVPQLLPIHPTCCGTPFSDSKHQLIPILFSSTHTVESIESQNENDMETSWGNDIPSTSPPDRETATLVIFEDLELGAFFEDFELGALVGGLLHRSALLSRRRRMNKHDLILRDNVRRA